MFRLSESAIQKLRIFSNRVQQAAIEFEGLFHQRFLPWDGYQEAKIDDEQWVEFIEANRPVFDEAEWWQCSMAYCNIGLSGHFLNRWFGNPDGMDYFERLVDSTLLVLEEVDFSGVNDAEIPFSFREFDDWVSTIHNWAFRFRMPFLRSEMQIWNSSTQGQQAFNELTKIWTDKGGVSIPTHPLCWTLYDDVFTCSAMAIEAMLNPSLLKTTKESAPMGAKEPESPLIVVDHDSNRLIETALGYIVVVAGSGRLLASRTNRIGLSRLAVLLSYPNEEIEAIFLSTVGVDSHRSEWENAPQLRRRVKAPLMKSDNEESYTAVRKEMERLAGEIFRAKDAGDFALQAELREELERYEDEYEFGADGLVYRKERDRDLGVKNKADTIQKGIAKALADMKKQAPEFAETLDALDKSIKRERGFLRYVPSTVGKPWTVTELS